MSELIYKEEAYAIVGAAMEVYNQLGNGFLEAVYQEALAIEFQLRGIPFQEQAPLAVCYKGQPLRQHYVADFVVYDKIIVEIKAIQQLGNNEQAQIMNYLKATSLELGLLINFGAPAKLQYKRVVRSLGFN
ncbi:MAG: GxxExxY protein [Anaerolineae bacterium]|nr:GxxExxY protein [Anaerolineae bacterium]